jgi:hypothetical protein
MNEDNQKILEWAIWANLDKHKNIELLLLKGHLVLEIVLDNFLKKNTSLNIERMSFYGKLKEIETIYNSTSHESGFVELLFKLNVIRNKFAHEWQFSIESSGIESWANEVVSKLPAQKYTRFTERTKLVHSFSALANEIISFEKKL